MAPIEGILTMVWVSLPHIGTEDQLRFSEEEGSHEGLEGDSTCEAASGRSPNLLGGVL